MFNLVAMKDTIRIPPWLFHLKLEEAIIEILNKKFANKVLCKVMHVNNTLIVDDKGHCLKILLECSQLN